MRQQDADWSMECFRKVLFTNEALVTDVKLLSSFGKSDHVSMKIELGVSLGKEPPPETSVIKKPN